jgi:hypothetical protein
MKMGKSQTPPTVVSKTTNKPITPEMQERINEFHKNIGKSMVSNLNHVTAKYESEPGKKK